MKKDGILKVVTIVSILLLLFVNCSKDSNDVLAPYKGERPLILLQITKNYTPDIQWLGGRVAAVGVNKGDKAGLESSLIWLMTADENSIGSYVTYGTNSNTAKILEYGGIPEDSLKHEVEYTYWLAEKSAFDAALDSTQLNEHNFIDTTFTMDLYLDGRAGGERLGNKLVVTISIRREQTLLEEIFTLDWEPRDIPFRRIAIREDASSGAFTDLIWDVSTPDSIEDNIYPPVIIGEPPEGTIETIAWPETGFKRNVVYFLWIANNKWDGQSFNRTAPGYAWFTIYPFN